MADKTTEHSSSEKLENAWPEAFISEFIVIAIINVFTVAAFLRNRHLRKSTTCLIINLTVADLLVGAVTGPIKIFSLHFRSWKWFQVARIHNFNLEPHISPCSSS